MSGGPWCQIRVETTATCVGCRKRFTYIRTGTKLRVRCASCGRARRLEQYKASNRKCRDRERARLGMFIKSSGKSGEVLNALQSGMCSTSQDVADEVGGLTADKASWYIAKLARQGRISIRRTGTSLPNVNEVGRGRRLQVFEVIHA